MISDALNWVMISNGNRGNVSGWREYGYDN
jgi:hypothetical protein